jgi:hypothetical protein
MLAAMAAGEFLGMSWGAGMVVVSALAALGGLPVLAGVRDGPYLASTSRFDARAALGALRDRRVRRATLGHFGHTRELYAIGRR